MSDPGIVDPRASDRPRSDQVPGSLVVGFSRYASSASALVTAAQLASRMAASLLVVHAIEIEDYPIDPDSWKWDEQGEKTIAEHENTVADLLADRDCKWSYRLMRGDPVHVLVHLADEMDALMIVVGSRPTQKPLVPHLRSPSVARSLIDKSRCPVLVVKAANRARD